MDLLTTVYGEKCAPPYKQLISTVLQFLRRNGKYSKGICSKVLLRLSITSALLVPKPAILISAFAVNIRYCTSADGPELVRGTAHFVGGEQTSCRLPPFYDRHHLLLHLVVGSGRGSCVVNYDRETCGQYLSKYPCPTSKCSLYAQFIGHQLLNSAC